MSLRLYVGTYITSLRVRKFDTLNRINLTLGSLQKVVTVLET